MKYIVLLTLLHCSLHSPTPIDFGSNFCPPVWPRPKDIPSDTDDPAPVFLGEDKESGCLCRQIPGKLVVCFGTEVCLRFPKNVHVNETLMRVKTTSITEIRKEDLENLTHLERLDIEGNVKLRKIEVGSFLHMNKLRNLSISFSENLEHLEPNIFEGLINLKQLFLVQNGFKNIADVAHALAPSYLPNVYKVELSENIFRIINKNDLLPLQNSTLRELNLIACQIEHIHPNSLTPLTNLSVLRLGENSFSTITITNLIHRTIEAGIPLKLLNLYSVGFRTSPPKKLLEAIGNSNISKLILSRNQFEQIGENSFPEMPNLELLDLRDVLAFNITSKAFSRMPKLRTLLLSGNKLSTIPDGVLLEQLAYLDLSANSGNKFFPSYIYIGRDKFVHMANLSLLNLSFNRVNSLYNDTFTGLTNLVVLGLKNSTIFHIGDGSFATLPNLRFLNLENNPFGGAYELRKEMFEGLEQLEVLLLGGCSIKHLDLDTSPFEHLSSLVHLGLENNHIHTLSPTIFAPLRLVQTVDVSQNTLSAWQHPLFQANTHLEDLSLTHNRFTHLSQAMLQDFSNLTSVRLSDNPFTCECFHFLDLRTWHKKSNDSILRLLKRSDAYCVYPDDLTNYTIDAYFMHLLENEPYCDFDKSFLAVSLGVPLVVLLFVSALSAFVIYKYRWHLRYWLFLARLQLSRTGKIRPKHKPCSYANFEYDAFVSYSNEDRNFVIRLVAMLENCEPFLKLCVYERDFQIGSIISESVLESVAKSRKTLLIISDSYARSQWCRWETQIAEHHRLFFEDEHGEYVDDSLVLIKLGPVCEAHVTPTLKYLLKTRIYLQWDADPEKQKVFWEKLRSTLSPPKTSIVDDAL